MSIELYVYTASAMLLSPGQLVSEAKDIDWNIAFVTDAESLQPAPAATDCLVLGFRSSSSEGAQVQQALKAHDSDKIQTLFQEEAFALIELDADLAFVPDPEELDQLVSSGVSQAHIARIRDAKTRYILRTSASRNDLSLELQTELWGMIGVLTDGLCEDPEEGTFHDMAEQSEE